MTTICVLVQSFYDLDPRVRRKTEALVAAGYEVDVLALRSPNRDATYTLNGVNVYTVALGKERGSLARYMFEYAAFFLWAFVRVPLLMRRRHYVAIDVNTLPDFLIFAPVIARWMGAKLILDMHEITPEFFMSKYGIAERSPLIRLITWLERVSSQFADHVLTVNQPIQDVLIQRGLPPSKGTVIMNAVDEAPFVAAARRHAANEPARADRFVMMYHGTLTRIYGLDLAIEAFAMVHQEMPGAELWILGSGSERDALADQARRSGLASVVRLVGQVPRKEIPAWLAQCDLGLLPFRVDVFLDLAFPNKLPEFIVMGKPVAVPRMKAIGHYFSGDALAYFEPNDAADLAKQMVRVYRDRALGRRLAARAAQEYAPIRWHVMKQRYLDVVDAIAGPVRQPVVAGARLVDKVVEQ